VRSSLIGSQVITDEAGLVPIRPAIPDRQSPAVLVSRILASIRLRTRHAEAVADATIVTDEDTRRPSPTRPSVQTGLSDGGRD
jgi:hypothetical protein